MQKRMITTYVEMGKARWLRIIILYLALNHGNVVGQPISNTSSDIIEYTLDYIDISAGLSNNYVSKIAYDKFGMMWFASEGGLNRYDGQEFKTLRPNERYSPGLINENIETVFIDSKGLIWVGTKSGGISLYNQAEDQFTNLNHIIDPDDNIPFIRITDVAEDKEGNIWIATWGLGLYKLSAHNYELEASFLTNRIIQDIEVDPYGNVWAISNNMIHKYDPSEFRLVNLTVDIGMGYALFYDDISEELLVGSSDGFYGFDITNYSISEFSESNRLGFEGVNSINVDDNGRIWIGSWSRGLHVSNSARNKFEKFSLAPGTVSNTNYETVLDIVIDTNGLIWVSTGFGGIVRLSTSASINYLVNDFDNDINLVDNNIQSVLTDSKGYLWCGTWNSGISYSKDLRHFITLPGTKNTKISTFLELDNRMLVGTTSGVLIFDMDNLQKGPLIRRLHREKIKDIYLDSQNRLWVGTQQHGLFLYDYVNDKNLEKGVQYQSKPAEKNDLNSDRISEIVEDREGQIWVGTYNGLYRYNSGDSTFIRLDNLDLSKFPSVIMLSLHIKGENEMWIGMPGGLLKSIVTEGNLRIMELFDSERGLKNDYITAVTSDKNGNIWLSDASGIASIRNESNSVININLNQKNSYAMNINAYYNDGKMLYFGSSNGLFYFDPIQVNLTTSAPTLVFNKLKIDNKEILVGDLVNGREILNKSMPYTDQIEITHKESVVSLGFVPNDFRDRGSLNYYYRVIGLQDTWINNETNSEINFIGLDAGTYTIEVKSTHDKVHFSEIAQLKLTVLPPPWLSPWAFVVYIVILSLIVLIIIQVFTNRAKLKADLRVAELSTEKEHELNEAKLRFFTNVTHELKTPLTLILSPINEILADEKLKKEVKDRLNYVETNARKLQNLINELIDFRKAEKGEVSLQVAKGNIVKFAKEIYLSFKGYADTQDIDYEFVCSKESIDLTFDRNKMEVILGNLLSNAFKYTPREGKIVMRIEDREDFCTISINDTGKGIASKNFDKIFDRFYQIKDSDSIKVGGSGIGLSLTKRFVELHSGKIKVKSALGKGAEFIIKLPKGVQHFEEDQFIIDFKDSEAISLYDVDGAEPFVDNGSTSDDDNQQKLLVIDDNPDILSYLQTIFEENGYSVATAVNGAEGRDKAFELIPDLIISDVMMPELDGIELCKILKNDISTSHIPLILLTARTARVYEVDGLDTGADDYIRKPFDAMVIRARVASLLENRQKVRAFLANKIRFEPKSDIQPINKEEKFIAGLSELIEHSMNEKDFSIDMLADEMCMSQSTLYRKIKSLTGLSIAGFIRSIRLKKSTELLITEDSKLSAIAYEVGFNDYKYFKKSFTEQYGMSPKEYRENAFSPSSEQKG